MGLTQIAEFSYMLLQVARDNRLVSNDVYNVTLAASVITILLNGFPVRRTMAETSAPRLQKGGLCDPIHYRMIDFLLPCR